MAAHAIHTRRKNRLPLGLSILVLLVGSCQNGVPKDASLEPGGASLVGILVSPLTDTLSPGQSSDFDAAGLFSDSTVSANLPVTWTTTGGTVNSSGRYTAGSTGGDYTVSAAAFGFSGSAIVTVVEPTITALELSPPSVSLQPTQVSQFSVTASLSDGTTDPDPAVTWTATGGTINGTGRYTAGNTNGSFRVIATSGAIADTAPVTITSASATVTSISLTPASVSLQSGSSQQFTVTANRSDGSTATNPSGTTFSQTGGSVTNGGRYTAGGTAGTFRLIATNSGKSDTSSITVTAPTITGITIAPSGATITINQTQSFSAVANLSNGGTLNNPAVTWSATGGTISSTGLFTAGAVVGTFRVIAACSCGPADTVQTFLSVSTEPSYQAGVDHLLHLDAFDSYGSTLNGAWETTPTGVSIIAPGQGGAGKAVRILYTPSDYYSGFDLRFDESTRIFVSYSFRILPAGYDVVEGDDTGSGMKWFTLWRDTDPRQTWGANELGGVQATTFGTHDNSSKNMPNPINGPSGLWKLVADGNWHRYTIEAYTGTGTNGYERCWIDGVKIFDTTGRGYDRSTAGFTLLQIGHDKVRAPLGTRTIDIDDFTAWTP